MAHGARSKFGVPMFEPKVIREQVYCVEESTCDIVVILAPSAVIRRPNSDSAPGELCPHFSLRLVPTHSTVSVSLRTHPWGPGICCRCCSWQIAKVLWQNFQSKLCENTSNKSLPIFQKCSARPRFQIFSSKKISYKPVC